MFTRGRRKTAQGPLTQRLALGELESLARALLSVFLAFLHARVARQKTVGAQRRPQLRIELRNRARQAHAHRAGLPADATEPLKFTSLADQVDVVVTARGGGVGGQARAVRMGLSRAIAKFNPELRPSLRTNGFLTRDSRMKERKKYGQKGARKRFQFTKR